MRSIVLVLALGAISTASAQSSPSDEARAAFLQGKKALEQNDASKAVSLLEKAVSLDPLNWPALSLLQKTPILPSAATKVEISSGLTSVFGPATWNGATFTFQSVSELRL